MTAKGKGSSGGGRRVTPESAAKRARAAALRAEGLSWQLCADGAGYGSIGAVREAVRLYWKDQPDKDPAELRKEMIGELESMETVLDKLENAEYVKVTPTGIPVVYADPETGEVHKLIDPAPAFEAIRMRLAVQKRKAELFGTDAPRRTAADVTILPPELPEHLKGLVDPDDTSR